MSEHEKNQEQEKPMDSVSDRGGNDSDQTIDVVEDTGSDAEADLEVQDPEAQIEALNETLSREREKYLRALADLDNLRKRSRRDVEDARIKGQMNVLEEMLPALDSIDMALKSITPNDANQAVYDGMLMVQRQFISSMERFNLTRVNAVGQKFDPAIHEAVSYVPSMDVESGAIIAEMRSGYLLGDKLLRASMVVVSAGQPAQTAENAPTAPETESDAGGSDSTSTADTNGQPN